MSDIYVFNKAAYLLTYLLTYFFPLIALATPVIAPERRKSWLRPWTRNASGTLMCW